MSDHLRETIRDKIVALLSTPEDEVYPTPAEGRVYPNRKIPVFEADLPCILVYFLSEQAEQFTMSATYTALRTLQVVVEAIVGPDDMDDSLDDLALAIETVMLQNPRLDLSFVERNVLTETSITKLDEGSKEMGSIQVTFPVTYYFHQTEAEDETAVDLELIHNEFDIPPTDLEDFQSDFEADAEIPAE